jgi:hypothetical protein
MASANGTISLNAALNEVLSSGLRSGVVAHLLDLSALQTMRLSSGVAAGQIDLVSSSKDIAILASSSLDVDVAGGLTDSYGATITMAKVKLLAVYNAGTVAIRVKSTTGQPLAILNGTTDAINLGPGAAFFYFDPVGVTVGAGTTDRFTIVNVSASVASAHTLIVAGTSS